MTINEFKQVVAGSDSLPVWWTAADGDGGHSRLIEDFICFEDEVCLYPHDLEKPTEFLRSCDIIYEAYDDSEIFVVVDGDKYPIKQVNLNKNWVEIVA